MASLTAKIAQRRNAATRSDAHVWKNIHRETTAKTGGIPAESSRNAASATAVSSHLTAALKPRHFGMRGTSK